MVEPVGAAIFGYFRSPQDVPRGSLHISSSVSASKNLICVFRQSTVEEVTRREIGAYATGILQRTPYFFVAMVGSIGGKPLPKPRTKFSADRVAGGASTPAGQLGAQFVLVQPAITAVLKIVLHYSGASSAWR